MTSKAIKNSFYGLQITAIMLFNLASIHSLCIRNLLALEDVSTVMKSWLNISIPGLLSLMIIALNHVFDHKWKARLVFWRWRHPLPGSRVFSEYCRDDSRIDLAKLKKQLGPFPREAGKQNALWYRLYRSVDTRPEVMNVHRNYLLLRDWASIAALLGLFSPSTLLICSSKKSFLFVVLLLGSEYLLVRQAAANTGKRFVLTVLAIKAAESDAGESKELSK